MINGTATKPFVPTYSLQQRDPLLPYLFLFCMDILSRMTSLAINIRQFQGISLRHWGPTISHMFFTDDSLIFFPSYFFGLH